MHSHNLEDDALISNTWLSKYYIDAAEKTEMLKHYNFHARYEFYALDGIQSCASISLYLTSLL